MASNLSISGGPRWASALASTSTASGSRCLHCRPEWPRPRVSPDVRLALARRNHNQPPKMQLQRYLEQARLSIQRATETLHGQRQRLAFLLNTRAGELGSQLNQVSGYDGIDKLKTLVVGKEEELRRARDIARNLKIDYDKAIAIRATAQKSVNSLLERKDRWTDADVADFTSLIRSDHASTHAVTQTSSQLDAAEADVDRLFSELTQSILTRYHEEQVWSDKIRAFSTYAGLVGLAVNLVVFVGAIAFVEPWKRRKLAEGLEIRMANMMTDVRTQISALTDEIKQAKTVTDDSPTASASPEVDFLLPSSTYTTASPDPADVSLLSDVTDIFPVNDNAFHSKSEIALHRITQRLTELYSALNRFEIEPVYLASVTGLAVGAGLTWMFR